MSERLIVEFPDGTLELMEAWREAGEEPEDFVRASVRLRLRLERERLREATQQ